MATRRYLPVGTKVAAVRRHDGYLKPEHTTAKEITLPKGDVFGVHPVTGDRVPVYTEGPWSMFYDAAAVKTVDVLDPINFRAVMLQYDIPDALDFPNPSGELRRLGVRSSLSVWVLPESAVPHLLLNRMTEAGVLWHVVRFDATEAPKLAKIALNALRKEIADQVLRSRQSMERANRALDETTDDPAKAEEAYLKRLEAIEARYAELVEDLEVAAHRFGLDPTSLGQRDAATAVAAISSAMHDRAATYARAVRELRATGSTGEAAAAAAETGSMPVGVMADMLDDTGTDENAALAKDLREQFAGVDGSFVPAADDGSDEFRLV